MPTKKPEHPSYPNPTLAEALAGEHPDTAAVNGAQAVVHYSLSSDIAQLKSLVSRGELVEAEKMVKDLEQRWPGDEQVRKFARVLAPPTVSVRQGSPARSRSQEYQWLREHAHEYPGSWLAVLGERLVAADSDVRAVVAAVKKDPTAKGALLHFQPGD